MTPDATEVAMRIVSAAAVYCLIGAAFAAWFAIRGARMLNPGARDGTLGFRLLILPGAAALWPLLAAMLIVRSVRPHAPHAAKDENHGGGSGKP